MERQKEEASTYDTYTDGTDTVVIEWSFAD